MAKVIKQNSIHAWILAARPKTLTGACIPIFIASALAWNDGKFQWKPAIICFAFACLMQIAANFINDLYDFLKGSDRSDRLGPERACAQGWISSGAMKIGITLTIILACTLGLLLLSYGGLWLIAIGIACVVFAFLYTLVLSYYGLGDLLVLVFFGFVPVIGTYYVQAGTVTFNVIICSIISGFLIDTLLIINNYRDRDTDKATGKHTLIAQLGERFGRYDYLVTGLLAWICCIFFLIEGHTWAFILPMVYIPMHIRTWREMTIIHKGKALNRILGLTSRNMLFFAILLCLGLLL